MNNLVYSSKSLLDSIGSKSNKNNNNQLEQDNNEPNLDDGTFALASTLSNVPKPDYVKEINDNDNDSDSINNKNKIASNNTAIDITKSDTESLSSDIIIDNDNDNNNSTNSPNEKHKSTIKSKIIQLLPLLNPSNFLSSHDLLLNSFYEEHKLELVTQKKISLRVITWNLNQMKPPSLKSLAGRSGREWAAFFYAGDATVNNDNKEGLADIYSINFQETISLTSFSKNNNVIEEWVQFLLSVLNAISSNSYSLVYSTGLLGLTSIILAKQYLTGNKSNKIDSQIHDIVENTLGLGYLRWANKGCISLKFKIGGIPLGVGNYPNYKKSSINEFTNNYKFDELDDTKGKIPGLEIQILNVHLVHGEGDAQIQQRWDSWSKIQNKIGLIDRNIKLTLDPNKIEIKDDAQKRLELKLQQTIHKNYNKNENNNNNLDKEMSALYLNNDSVRSSSVPLNFSKTELKKFEGIITSLDLQKLTYVTEATKALIVCGDTNYRLALPPDNTLNSKNIIQQLIRNGNWDSLLEHDQLKAEMKKKKVFIGFKESQIYFAPTFKVQPDALGNWIMTPPSSSSSSIDLDNNEKMKSNERMYRKPIPVSSTGSISSTKISIPPYYVPNYDNKRLPAYTDRILYTPNHCFDVIDGTYTSTGNVGSDHLPVAATYELDVPLINCDKLHYLKGKFNETWDEIINKMQFIKFDKEVIIKHSLLGYKKEKFDTIPKTIDETIKTDGGNISFSAIVGETIKIIINFENIVDEAFNFVVKEQTKSGWFGLKVDINCQEINVKNKSAEFLKKSSSPSCSINSHCKGEINLTLVPTTAGLLERMFYSEIPEYSLCPAFRKFIALTIDVKDIFGASFEDITIKQFENIDNCFKFIVNEKSIVGLLNHIEDLKNTGDLNTIEWDLVREVTLWDFKKEKYENLNKDGIEAVKRREAENFNLGSKTVIAFLYIWLKAQNTVFNTETDRGKVIFSNVIKLIKYLKLNGDDAYSWFGWLFTNEYELEEYLEQDFDVKVHL